MSMRIGIDLGGTKIEGLALADNGQELLRHRIPTPQRDYPGTLDSIANLVHYLEQQTGEKGRVGLGTPGSISPSNGLIRNANSTCLNGKPLDQDLTTILQRSIRIANDADCFTLSEARDGAAEGAKTVFGVIIGTGTGGGIVMDGQLTSGPNRIAGEWGHNPLPWPKPEEQPGSACYCGKTGCIETFLSGPGLSAAYERDHGLQLTAREITVRAGAGEPQAERILETYEDRLARSLASIINVLDPDVIVLGGGLSQISRLYHTVPARWGNYVFSDIVNTRLVPPKHGDASGVRGAAWLWSD